jgi:hypothetical protein
MPSPSTSGEEVVVVGWVVLVVDEVVLLVVDDVLVVDDAGTLVLDDGTVIVVVVVVGSPGSALAPELSARGTTNATTATSTVAPVVIGVGAGEVRQWSLAYIGGQFLDLRTCAQIYPYGPGSADYRQAPVFTRRRAHQAPCSPGV